MTAETYAASRTSTTAARGGWGIIAADVLVMASLAQVTGQYVFLLFGVDGVGAKPSSG